MPIQQDPSAVVPMDLDDWLASIPGSLAAPAAPTAMLPHLLAAPTATTAMQVTKCLLQVHSPFSPGGWGLVQCDDE